MGDTDVYYKKTVKYEYRGHNLQFRISQELFSSNNIDNGTQRLLRTLSDEKIDSFNKALDLGCGYGPLGITLKTVRPIGEVHMTDKDALALEYSRQNAKLNSLEGIKIYGSLGYDDIQEDDFDLIVSNIPAKVGEPVLAHLLLDAQFHLQPQGKVAIVVIDAIANYVINLLSSNPNISILFQKSWPGHVVLHYKFTSNKKIIKQKSNSLERGIYGREEKDFTVESIKVLMKTTYNLPEFDTLSYDTKLLLNNLPGQSEESVGSVIVFNPGQGFIPVYISKLMSVKNINLVDRDLQALRISKENLVGNGYTPENITLVHQVGILGEKKVEYLIGILPEKDGSLVNATIVRQSASRLTGNGMFVVSSSSTAITRIKTLIRKERLFNFLREKRSKGRTVLMLKSK